MTIKDLQARLIEAIRKTYNPDKLEEACQLLEVNFDDDEVYEFNKAQLAAIREAREQVKNGQFITNEQAQKEADEWLKKR